MTGVLPEQFYIKYIKNKIGGRVGLEPTPKAPQTLMLAFTPSSPYEQTFLVKRIPSVCNGRSTHGFLSVSRLIHEPSQHVPDFYCAVPHFSRSLRDMCQDGSGFDEFRTHDLCVLTRVDATLSHLSYEPIS